MTKDTTTNWRKTLNLPATPFPMRANLAQNEAASVKRWDGMDLYEQVTTAREGCDPFTFHDGPPFANGDIHAGHLLNKVLKDIVVRSRLMSGQQCRYVPGWDCHGLPIEYQVMTDLVASGKMEKLAALDDDTRRMAIRRACRKYAEKFQKRQAGQMKRLLTLADYEHPYMTMDASYEAAVLDVFADLVQAGLVYRRLKPVHWSIANQTALAEAELEYHDRVDPSIWVDFTVTDADAAAAAFGVQIEERPAFMIWTTTPWTLPANMAIAVGPRITYALARINGSLTIVASERLKAVAAVCGADEPEVLGTCLGEQLAELAYQHPFCERTGPILLGEHVTLEDGTGLVHTAPGHGTEDYLIGLAAGLEVYCPVRGDGTFDDTAPEWLRGLSVWDGNAKVVDHLRELGNVVHVQDYTHSYPHDWRSKTPVIFRSTEQWFVDVNADFNDGPSLRQRGVRAIDQEIAFVPEWGRARMRGMVEARPDWCLSRQRSWGLPIPAFLMKDGSMLLTAATTRAVSKAFGKRGSDAWFLESPEQLLADWNPAEDPDAPDDIKVADLRKTHEIFDVWMESGSSWHAVMRSRGLGFPSDLYLEGSDQHRGWFQLSMLASLGMSGVPPFRALLTHGFIVDRQGRKMSKSGDNALSVEDLLKDVGADVCRWWVSALAYENDIRADLELFQLAGESYRKVRNTIRFLLSNIGDLNSDEDHLGAMPDASLERWLLAKAATLQETVMSAWDTFEFRRAHVAIFDFCNDTLSSTFCVAMKDRLYCDQPNSPRRRRAQAAMRSVAELLCRLLAPMIPHTADEAWRAMRGEDACLHLETLPPPPPTAAAPAWDTAMDIRELALRALEQAKQDGIEKSLDAGLVIPDPDGTLTGLREDLRDLLEVSRLTFDAEATEIAVIDLRDQPACERSWRRDETVAERPNGSYLSDRDWEAVALQE
ncbi:MAG: isoleucine--tRNA ligase [Phycisphaerales bacterium]|jgi:isoleucyl-tRNA synthetase|nr:isoleucine--tRNA ligase [Phycisphaerales bacterium]